MVQCARMGPRDRRPCGDPHADTGFPQHVLNYAFNSLFDIIPSRADGHMLYFDVRQTSMAQSDVHAKKRNFYKAFEYIKAYPTSRKLMDTIGICDSVFYGQVCT